MNIVRVPVKIGNTTVVLSSVKHYEVEQIADRKRSPDAKVVVHVDLTDGHPFKVL